MHISLISSSLESLPSAGLFQPLNDITLYEVSNLENLLNNHIRLDLIFFDAALGMHSITQQIELYQKKNQDIKWLVINATDIQQSLLYLQLGASGLLKQPCEKTLQDCFDVMSKDQLYLEHDFIQILALRQIKKTLLPFKQLTAREYDVFCLLAEDYSIQVIAELLMVSTKTAFNCQAQLRKKLELSKQHQLVAFAKKHGVVN